MPLSCKIGTPGDDNLVHFITSSVAGGVQMTRYSCLMATCVLELLHVCAMGAEPLPEPATKGTGLGHTLAESHVTGPYAGKLRSMICELAGRPAILVYTRETDPTLLRLLTKLDEVAQGGKEQKMTSSCVLLTTKDEDYEHFQALAKREKLEATILATTPLQWERPFFGNYPSRRDVHKEAAVMVIVLQKLRVQSSYAFREGELNNTKIDEIVEAAAALLAESKRK
jgi:hypothetical protein